MRWLCLVCLAVLTRQASAEPARISTARRVAAIAAAVFPGALLHGAGSWVAGDPATAKRLLLLEAAGLAGAAAGGGPIAYSGSSPYTIWEGVPLVVGGAGVWMQSWLADIYAAAGGSAGAPRAVPPWSVELATTWLHDAYRERALVGGGGHVELGALGLDATGYVDAHNAARAGELGVRWRLLGAPAGGQVIRDGSRLVVRAALRRERDDDDRVSVTTAEAVALGRLDLAHVDALLAGSFAELGAGAGLQRTGYPHDQHDHDAILLAGFAWGLYLGTRGEARVFYDHRRDGLAGGLAASHAAGFVGSVGAAAEVRITGPWAVRGQLQIGNAWVSTLGVRYLGGE